MNMRNKIVGIVFTAMVFIMLILVLISPPLYVKNHFISIAGEAFDTAKAYPFSDNSSGTDTGAKGEAKAYGQIARAYDLVITAEDYVKRFTTDLFAFQPSYAVVKKFVDRTMGIDMTSSLSAGQNNTETDDDIVVPYSGDYLALVADDADVSEVMGSLITFGEQMKDDGRNFLFFMAPEKFAGNMLYKDYSVERREEVIASLKAANIDTLDIEDEIVKRGIDKPSLFFRTDHHWLPSTGIWATSILGQYMNENYAYNIDTSLFDMENYETTVLEKHFLGSLGKKVTHIYTAADDFPIIVPKYDTDLEVFFSSTNENVRGNIQETLFDYSAVESDDLYSRSNYEFYGYLDQALVSVKNNNVHDGSRVLLVKTSFADTMYPYLAATVENLDVVDLRYFKGSLQTFIEETDPDTVIMIYGLKSFNSYSTIAWDFR